MAVQEKQELSPDTKLEMISQFSSVIYDMTLVLVMAPVLFKVFSFLTGSEAWRRITIVLTYKIKRRGEYLTDNQQTVKSRRGACILKCRIRRI
jgi:hypothetical protein